MKKLFIIVSCIALIISSVFAFETGKKKYNTASAEKVVSRYTVVIDAGHGGRDVGTIGVDGSFEKDINLDIALSLYDFLSVCGINSVLIRSGDYELYKEGEVRNRSDLYNRLDFINSIDNSALISIHQNHFENEAEWGTQIWFSANNDESKIIADNILSNVKTMLQPDNKRENKVSDNSYYILYKALVPSVMVECGFMSNIKENMLLQSGDYQCDMAFSIMSGICNIV
jgi:N-acetylmuramoyl-L-alanine amidase